jgi:hypothetical protein
VCLSSCENKDIFFCTQESSCVLLSQEHTIAYVVRKVLYILRIVYGHNLFGLGTRNFLCIIGSEHTPSSKTRFQHVRTNKRHQRLLNSYLNVPRTPAHRPVWKSQQTAESSALVNIYESVIETAFNISCLSLIYLALSSFLATNEAFSASVNRIRRPKKRSLGSSVVG